MPAPTPAPNSAEMLEAQYFLGPVCPPSKTRGGSQCGRSTALDSSLSDAGSAHHRAHGEARGGPGYKLQPTIHLHVASSSSVKERLKK